ncbi:MAG: hypothetical protein HKP59_00715 [Lutibacter sp.]|uniref:toxin-antitoxin system YwqK family antitoxin n=1 Tax=Lutibacter sp. TaxID=1925666 RepID=UPI00184B6151|nr:hypothetical protein [Lutibacter sp.]MBT8316126.1 hypothetical protein [Lutibacter sp.]NNJ56986.1 hypothetical protein [Lutibacter sp.]
MTEKQSKDFLSKLSKMSSSNLSKLAEMSPRQLNSFVASSVETLGKNTNALKNVIAGVGDKAGNTALKAVSKIDDIIASGGKIPRALITKLKDVANGLPPGRAKAFLDYLKTKSVTDWKNITDLETPGKGPGGVVGAVVDGVFVLYDAYDIYYSDDEPEIKAINATSKGVGYVVGTAGTALAGAASNATVTAIGGFGPGLVVAFTADRVSTLTTEVLMLVKEREAAKNAEENERIDNAILVRRQLLNISNKIKSGQVNNAQFLLSKLDKFMLNNRIDDLDKLYELHGELEDKAQNAERNQLINEVINTARHPYQKAANFYKKGVELHIAKIYAAEALTILNNNLKIYPEIGGLTAISKTQQLIRLIDEKIANAADFSITRVAAPERVYIGQSIDIPVFVKGGIPYYSSVGEINSNISDDSEVTVFWYASVVPGIENFTITLKDCMGSTASTSVSIEVVEEIEEEIVEADEEPVDVEYSGLKEFVDVSKIGSKTFESHYFASKFHIGYSKEYRDKVYSGRGENNEGPWLTGNPGEGQETIWYILPHGPYKRYRTDNENILIQEGNYNNGLWHGKWIKYFIKPDTQGGVEKIQNYKNGVLDGIQTTYIHYKSKEDWSKIENYKDGKKDGTQIEYDSEIPGGIGKERIYQNGKFISGYYYYFSGKEKGANGKYINIYEKAIYEE